MPLPTFAVPAHAPRPRSATLTRNQAASRLGLSLALVDKLMRAGILETPILAATVDGLADRSMLAVVAGELTVLRTDARADAHPGEDRRYIGFHVEHTDAELEATSLRWWRSEPAHVLDNELFAVTVSTVPVAVYGVHEHLESIYREGEDKPRHRYAGVLLGRVYPGMAARTLPHTPGHLRDRVEQIMASRIKVSSGGPIGYLQPSP